DVHISIYQLPDAPPPPKLPPPPPLSLELLLLLSLELLLPLLQDPPDEELLSTPLRRLRPATWLAAAKISATNAITKTIMVARSAAANEPETYQASAPTIQPVTVAPSNAPSRLRMTAPKPNSTNRAKIGSMWLSTFGACQCGGSAAGNFSPSITRIIRLTPAEIPPAKSPDLNFGVISSSMMRLEVTSVSAPSRP